MFSLEKSIYIEAGKKKVFDALTQPKWIKMWTGDDVEMDLSPGGHFALWGGSIIGINRLISEDRIEQDWKEEQWPKFSKVILTLEEDENGFTTLVLKHDNIPEKALQAIDLGWDDYYFGPLKEVCENEFYNTNDEYDYEEDE
jgi:activator of HSP90 ATPase